MRVLHVDTEQTWRGGENQIRLLVEGLSARGVESHLVAKPDSAISKRLGPVIPHLALPMRGGVDLVAAYRMAVYCRRHQIDIIDAHSGNAHSLALASKLFYRRPQLVVHRRVDFVPKNHALNRWKYLHPGIGRYVAISGAIGRILGQFGVCAEQIAVVPSAVDPKKYELVDRSEARAHLLSLAGLGEDTVILGNGSALTHQKGYPTLLRALDLLHRKRKHNNHPPFHCFIAGDGHLQAELVGQVNELGLQGVVTFLGWIDWMDSFLSGLDILAMPSEMEGLGTLILDGTYAGACVVATDVGGIGEMIQHEKGGLLCQPGDFESFAQNLERVLGDHKCRQRYHAYTREWIATRFGLEAMVLGNIEVYERLLKPLDRRL